MSTAARVFAVILMLVAFSCAFFAVAADLTVTQPAVKASTAQVQFAVGGKKYPNDSAGAIGDRLARDGLIRNATAFKLLARYRQLDTKLETGIYTLSPSMTMDEIISKLLSAPLQEVEITVPPGHRVSEYPAYFSALPNFDAANFLRVATTGVLKNGNKLSDKYWYLPPKQPNTAFALEGYLFPDTYFFNADDDEERVIQRLIDGLGTHLCPSPDQNNPYAYILDEAQCKAHADAQGKTKSIFTEMEQHFNTTDDVKALYDTLILSSIVVREVKFTKDIPGIADVYYNRYVIMANGTNLTPGGDTIVALEADPTVIYARDTDTPPANGLWWKKLADSGRNVDPNSVYNMYTHKGLMPGPIAAPRYEDIIGIATADEPPSPNFWFVNDCNGVTHFASTFSQFQSVEGLACQS